MPETLPEGVLAKMHAPPKPDVPILDVHELPKADGFIFGFPTRWATHRPSCCIGLCPARWPVLGTRTPSLRLSSYVPQDMLYGQYPT